MTNPNQFLLFAVVVVSAVLNLAFLQGEAYPHPKPLLDKTKNLSDLTPEEREALIEKILSRLIRCESGGNPKAIGLDRNGATNRGILQFKPKTLRKFAIKYGFLPKTIKLSEVRARIHDPDLQIKTAREMIKRNGHRKQFWKTQFPGCSKRMGLW
ncbi:MAG TPA: transglycosylase SLT domain-containing protein [Candidatus Limnocylindrales bacterium]|nr:transglycosylase SLT domain-containing protein [Candidatus Limnocylindrales bacterium]